MMSMGPTHESLRVTPWLVVKVVAASAVGGVLLTMAATAAEQLMTVVLMPLVILGLVGRHGLPGDTSRLPAVVQGICLGAFLGMAIAVSMLDGWHWPLLGWLLPMTILFPGVLPARLRRSMTAMPEVDDEAIERTRWTDSRR